MCFMSRLITLGIFLASSVFGDLAFVTNFRSSPNGLIYSFETTDVTTAATQYPANQVLEPDMIAFSPDGSTVYFTTYINGDVYKFQTSDPTSITQLNVTGGNFTDPMGIAISSDGTLGFVTQDFDTGVGIYSFPTAGSTHTPMLLTPTTATTIANPLYIVISGDNAFVGDMNNGIIYSVTLTATTYTATVVQPSLGGGNIGGLAISSDGFLYISGAFSNQIYRVPLSDPTQTPIPLLNSADLFPTDGLAVSNDGKTVFFTAVGGGILNNGVYSFSTEGPFPTTFLTLNLLNIPQAIAIAIQPNPLPPPIVIDPPTKLKGFQKINDFGLIYERFNVLNWQASDTSGVVGYFIFRDGELIATVGADTFSYEDHDQPKSKTLYSVAAFDALGNVSTFANVTIQGR